MNLLIMNSYNAPAYKEVPVYLLFKDSDHPVHLTSLYCPPSKASLVS